MVKMFDDGFSGTVVEHGRVAEWIGWKNDMGGKWSEVDQSVWIAACRACSKYLNKTKAYPGGVWAATRFGVVPRELGATAGLWGEIPLGFFGGWATWPSGRHFFHKSGVGVAELRAFLGRGGRMGLERDDLARPRWRRPQGERETIFTASVRLDAIMRSSGIFIARKAGGNAVAGAEATRG
jgi:hypothetical protein